MKKAVAVLAALFVGGLVWSIVTVKGAEGRRSYVFSSDPQETVLTMRIWGGLSQEVYEYTLFGDGRFVRTIGQKARVTSRTERSLDFAEVDDLVRAAVDGGLMEWDHEAFGRTLREQVGGPPILASDSPRVRIVINLDEYWNSQGEKVEPPHVQIDTTPPSSLKAAYPQLEIKELDALVSLSAAIERRFRAQPKEQQP
jgi:hypothetical protein